MGEEKKEERESDGGKITTTEHKDGRRSVKIELPSFDTKQVGEKPNG